MNFNDIGLYAPTTSETYLENALKVAEWIDKYSVKKEIGKSWQLSSGEGSSEGDNLAQKLTDRTIYSGAAGIGYFYIQLYEITKDEKYLKEALEAGEYILSTFDEELGKKPGIHTGLAGEGLYAELLYKKTGNQKYRDYAIKAGETVYSQAERTPDGIHWYAIPDYMGDASVIAYWIYLADITGDKKYLSYAKEALDYIVSLHLTDDDGLIYWKFLDLNNYFPELPKGGIVANFAHGTSGIVYLLTKYYSATKDEEYLKIAESAYKFLTKIAVQDDESAIVPYIYFKDHDPFDVFYLSMCHGPVGTGIVSKALYRATGNDFYLNYYKKFTNALIKAGVPNRSKGYWNDCICCGSSGVLLQFIDAYITTSNLTYKKKATEVANKLISDAFKDKNGTRWYNAWTRVIPWNVDAHIGLYIGAAGSASTLLSLYALHKGIEITNIYEFL